MKIVEESILGSEVLDEREYSIASIALTLSKPMSNNFAINVGKNKIKKQTMVLLEKYMM